jgi:DNA-nicking Smr family endonuclease
MGLLDSIIRRLIKIFSGDSKSDGHYPQEQHGSFPSSHKPGRYNGEDQNQINQRNERYLSLRAQANQEGDAMAQCFDQSHKAYSSGAGARAKELSNEGHQHQQKMESLNKQASDWIFTENNKDSKPGEIDLHGLYVKEAIAQTDSAIQRAKKRGDSDIRLIVGKGLHSTGGRAKIKPAIEELIQKHQLVAELDSHNAGVLVVRLDGQGRGMDSDEVTRRLERGDDACIIM